MLESHFQRSIGDAFRDIDGVESVYAVTSGNVVTVFTVIEEEDEDRYDRIYDRERALIRGFENLNFDFNVIARRGRSIADIVGLIY